MDDKHDDPPSGHAKDRDKKAERLETEVTDLRAKLDAARAETVNLGERLTATTAAREVAEARIDAVTAERDSALCRAGELSEKLEDEISARRLVEIERDDIRERLETVEEELRLANASLASAEAAARSERASKEIFQVATAATALAHLFRK